MFKTALHGLLIMAVAISKGSFETEEDKAKVELASMHAAKTMSAFFQSFLKCLDTKMPLQQFIYDDPAQYLNGPLRTTVGSVPRYTNNRKFFANLIATPQFKEMLAKDEEKFKSSYVSKMKFCRNAIMDKSVLVDLYDREIRD